MCVLFNVVPGGAQPEEPGDAELLAPRGLQRGGEAEGPDP